jgi:rhodanese-related sulfurtransferase
MKLLIIFITFFSFGFSQKTIPEVLKKYNKLTVPYITVSELKSKKYATILDSREEKEFDVSHIKNAKWVGYDKFDGKKVAANFKNQNDTIIVYCSIGIRSENIGVKLKKLGYKNVFNLYGGIFEWKNQGNEVVDNDNKMTEKVHAFSKEWSKFLLKGKKIY